MQHILLTLPRLPSLSRLRRDGSIFHHDDTMTRRFSGEGHFASLPYTFLQPQRRKGNEEGAQSPCTRRFNTGNRAITTARRCRWCGRYSLVKAQSAYTGRVTGATEQSQRAAGNSGLLLYRLWVEGITAHSAPRI